MDSGCCLCCFNCCFFNCFDSFWLSIIQFISSIIGIVANSYILSISKKIFDSSKFLFSTQVVNISFFSGGTGLSTILLFLKKFDKINQGCFYKFSWLSSKIYSICSKVMMIINIFGFFYMIGFTHFLTMDVGEYGGKKLFNYSLYDYVGPGKEIEYSLRYRYNNSYCQEYENCTSDELLTEEEEENFSEVSLSIIFSLISCIITFFNGESFSSDSKRIKFLSSGKISLELRPIEAIACLCRREKSLSMLNLLFCYKATVFNIEALLSIFSFIIFAFTIFLFCTWSNYFYPQTIYICWYILLPPLSISIYSFLLGLCCEDCCCKNRTPCWKKYCVIVNLIITIVLFFMEMIGFPLTVGSMNGKINYKADCSNYEGYNLTFINLYKSICYEDYQNKYLFITIKGTSSDRVFLIFIISLIEIILTFYLIVLMLNYINRSIPEHGFRNRIYDAFLYFVDKTGEKINIDDIKIESEIMKFTDNKGDKKVIYERNIYKRVVTQSKVPITGINPILYFNN